MALHDYAAELLGNRSTLRMLKALIQYRGKIFTMRELSRTSGISHPEVSAIVRKMEKRGIITLQLVGKAYQISLNEESYILKSIIEPMFRAEQNTLRSIISEIRIYFNDKRIVSAAIFGSVARGMEKVDSDVDLLVLTDDSEFASECVSKANILCVSRFGLALSPLILSRTHFTRKRKTDLERSILESYLMVNGIDLRKVVQNVQTS